MERPHFTTYNPNQMNAQFWASYPSAQQPFFYGRVQNKGLGVEFEPQSKFDNSNLDLTNMIEYYSADGGEQEYEDEENTEYEGEDYEGVEEPDLPRYKDLVRNKKLELKAQYGKAHFTSERKCQTIRVPQAYTERECKTIFGKQVCINIPKVRMVDQEVCAQVPKFVWGWRKKWREFKQQGGLSQLKMQSKGLAPIISPITLPPVTNYPTTTSGLNNPVVGTPNVIPAKTVSTRVFDKTKTKQSLQGNIIKGKSSASTSESDLGETSTSKKDKFLGMPKNIGIGVTVVVGSIMIFGAYKLLKK